MASDPQLAANVAAIAPSKLTLEVGRYSDGSGPVVTIEYNMTSQALPDHITIQGASDLWVSFDVEHADEIARQLLNAAHALRARKAAKMLEERLL